MIASMDTNALIHFYRAKKQDIIYLFFDEGVYIFEQIRNVELNHHGHAILKEIDADIASGRLQVYTEKRLKSEGVEKLFDHNVQENRQLYGKGDLGEIYAISLAQTIGVFSLVTDDIKQRGPYMSLMQFDDEVMPLTFADVLILRYLMGDADASETVKDFCDINQASRLQWSLKSQMAKFIRRFWTSPYREGDRQWMQQLVQTRQIDAGTKMKILQKSLTEEA